MKRCVVAFVLGVAALAIVAPANAQVPGPNVNMVSGTRLPDGDPYLQRQNEPSMAVSTRNPCHLLGGANDYRTVELPGLPDDGATGDAWLGLFKSLDCGRTWKSTLIPGFPQDASADGLASPLRGLAAGADPMVRAGTNGLFYYSGIAFNRGDNGESKAFVARFIDNNVEFDAKGQRVDPIAYLGTSVIDRGSSGQFIDKPSIAVDVPRNDKTCSVAGQTVPAGTVYAVYSAFVGNTKNNTTKLMFSLSADCGASWSNPSKLSEGVHTNQGAAVAVAPNGTVYIAWRQFAYVGDAGSQPDAIVVARSTDGGKSFSKPVQIAQIAPFDQNTSGASFRTNTYPTMAIDGTSKVYVAWSARGFAAGSGDARIVMSTSADGASWSRPAAVDNPTAAEEDRGHQIMPALAYAAGQLQLIYYDLRDDQTYLDYLVNGVYSGNGVRRRVGDRAVNPTAVFGQGVSDATLTLRRHNVDVRGIQWAQGGSGPGGAAQRVSQYAFGITLDESGQASIRQVAFNPPNLPLYAKGTAAFLGDYIDVASVPFVPTSNGGWAFNTAGDGPRVFHAVWTDNRDVRPPASGKTWADYTPPGSPNCDPANPTTGLRNANIYTAAIAPPLDVTSPSNAKGLKDSTPAAFPVVVDNHTDSPKWYLLTVSAPAGVTVSFFENTAQPTLYVQVAGRSSAARTLFVSGAQQDARVIVNVQEVASPDGGTVPNPDSALLLLNGDRTNPAITNPDIMNPAITNQVFNPDIMNPDIMNPAITNPAITNPAITNPAIMNPDITNPDIMNPAIMNPDIMNPAITNPAITNPAIMNPTLANPDIMNPAITNTTVMNGVLTDMTWTVRNRGNTTGAYSVKLLLNQVPPANFAKQLIVHKKYVTPAAGATCSIAAQTQEQVIANLLNPTLQPRTTATARAMATAAGAATPDFGDVTLVLAPGEEAQVTLRVADPIKSDNTNTYIDGRIVSVDTHNFNPTTDVIPVVAAQAANVTGGTPEPAPIVVQASGNVTFVQQPTTVALGAPFPAAVQVRVTDAAGAVIPNAKITLSLSPNPGNAILANNEATTDATGVAIFSGLTVSAAGIGYQLEATGASVYTTTSDSFDVVVPGAAVPTLRQLAVGTPAQFGGLPTNVAGPIDAPNGAGEMLWEANSSALFFRAAGSRPSTMVLQRGDAVPGFPGSVTDLIGTVRLNASGVGLAWVDFYQAGAGKRALLAYDGRRSTFRTIVSSDDAVPGGSARFGRTFLNSFFAINDNGDVAYVSNLGTPNTSLFLSPAGGPSVRLVGYGDAAPVAGGGTLDLITPLALNNAGDVLFKAAVVAGSSRSGLFVASARAGVRKVVADGDSYSGVTFSFAGVVPVYGHLNNTGQVAFAYNNAVYVWTNAALSIAVAPGTTTPAPLAGTITAIVPSMLGQNDRGDLAFYATVALAGGGIRNALLEILASPTPTVEVIAYDGQPAPGVSGRTIGPFRWGTIVGAPSGYSYATMNDTGTAAFYAELDDLTTVLYKRPAGGVPVVVARSGQTFTALGGAALGDLGYFHFFDGGGVYFESFLTGGTAYYGAFFATDSSTTIMCSTADALPSNARISLRNGWLAAAGNYVAYNASRSGGAAAIYTQQFGSAPTKAVADGDPTAGPGSPRLMISNPTAAVPVNSNGTIAFQAYSDADDVYSVYSWSPGTGTVRLIGPNDPVPGTSVRFAYATLNVATSTTNTSRPPINDAGQVVVKGTWYDTGSKNGLFTVMPGAPPVRIVATGDIAPGAGTISAINSRMMNASGQVAFRALSPGKDGIFVAGGGLPLTKVVVTGDVLPQGTVTAIGVPGPLAFTDTGGVVFSATLSGAYPGGLFLATLSAGAFTVTPIALAGDPAPGAGGATFNLSATSIAARMNNAGDILFIAPLGGASPGSGLFLRRAGAPIVRIVRDGDPAPDVSGTFAAMTATINSIPGESIALGPTGEVLFENAVNVGSTQLRGWFRRRLDGTLQKVLVRGEQMPGCAGVTIVGLSQMAGVGSSRFALRVATYGTDFRDAIYTTALATDPLEGCLMAAIGNPAGASGAVVSGRR